MTHQLFVDPAEIVAPKASGDGSHEIAPDLAYKRLAIVNVVFYGKPKAGDREWVLIDAGIRGTGGLIRRTAQRRFGPGSRPSAIILTHGHFDHVGTLRDLAERWDVPIYAHELETPYLDGRRSYPPPNPRVGGGLMARISPLYPRGPINVHSRLKLLPANRTVPGMPGWVWIHTPGHSQGHISLWRESDRSLIAGDAFITTNQESAYAVALQRPEMHGPPMYYTEDWTQAGISVARLADLDPELVITGHGAAMHGEEMREALHTLARTFRMIAMPR